MTFLTKSNPWIHRPHPHPNAALRLFCFPYAGGGASVFRNWSDALPKSVEVVPVQLPGRETRIREQAFSSVFPLLDAMVPALVPLLDRPFALFGHSMGALIAFELARRLRCDCKRLPECLLVSARVAPNIRLKRQPINKLPEDELIRELAHLNGTDRDVLQHAELMKLVLPTLRADLALHEEYVYPVELPLACPIVAFGGLQDPETQNGVLDAWRNEAAGLFAIRWFSGDHFFITSQRRPFLSALAVELHRVVGSMRAGVSGTRLVNQMA